MSIAYCIQLPLEFPEGVHFGAGSEYNILVISRDGSNTPVLNGSSFAGVLRSIWRDFQVSRLPEYAMAGPTVRRTLRMDKTRVVPSIERLFGRAAGSQAAEFDFNVRTDSEDRQSRVKVTNYELEVGDHAHGLRTHHLRNRHRGTVVKNGLFSLESAPPGSSTLATFWIIDETDHALGPLEDSEVEEFISVVVAAFQNGVYVGGNSNRGIGRAIVNSANVLQRRFDLSDLDQHAEMLDAHYQWRAGMPIDRLEPFLPNSAYRYESMELVLKATLKIPRGQDLMVADGRANEVQMEPQRVCRSDGSHQWRLPGSTLRGLFRAWFQRLQARETLHRNPGLPPTGIDTSHEYSGRETSGKYTGESLGWCFLPECDPDKFTFPDDWEIADLFGSCFNPGRIKISDCFAACSNENLDEAPECQRRMHVSVDRITGGAAEGMLFENRVLVAHSQATGFPVTIRIDKPQDHDVRWLCQTLVALHIGLLRVGSSKSAGRLSIANLTIEHGTESVVGAIEQILGQHFTVQTSFATEAGGNQV